MRDTRRPAQWVRSPFWMRPSAKRPQSCSKRRGCPALASPATTTGGVGSLVAWKTTAGSASTQSQAATRRQTAARPSPPVQDARAPAAAATAERAATPSARPRRAQALRSPTTIGGAPPARAVRTRTAPAARGHPSRGECAARMLALAHTPLQLTRWASHGTEWPDLWRTYWRCQT